MSSPLRGRVSRLELISKERHGDAFCPHQPILLYKTGEDTGPACPCGRPRFTIEAVSPVKAAAQLDTFDT